MTERERLISLIIDSVGGCSRNWAEVIADYLLKNGVIVPPCKIGDNLFYEKNGEITCAIVDRITYDMYGDRDCPEVFIVFTRIDGYGYSVTFDDVGKLVFLTREEAEKALKEREK